METTRKNTNQNQYYFGLAKELKGSVLLIALLVLFVLGCHFFVPPAWGFVPLIIALLASSAWVVYKFFL
ncbi:MAG: hypothetical protein IJ184_02830 [Alphaproteobacteria bacterium]|nr:hypothetical protein [Alphaproteobacteria bacterium]